MGSRVKAVLRINESKLDKYIRNGLKTSRRLLWLRSEFRNHALNRDRVPILGMKRRFTYPCENCKQHFKAKQVEIDHINGVKSLFYLSDLPDYVASLFCHVDELQRLCVGCHRSITHGSNDL